MIIFYDEKLNIISFPIDDIFSLEWTEAWTEPGEWTLYLPKKYTKTAMQAEYIYAKDIGFGIVENIKITPDSLQIGGRGLEAYLDHFVITQERTLTGKAESAARSLIAQYAKGITFEEEKGYKNALAQAILPGSLMEGIYSVLNPRGMSCRLEIQNGKLFYRTLRGENKTNRQARRPWVQFSSGLKNLIDPSFEENDRDEKNRVIIRNSVTKDDVTTTTLYTYQF